MSKLLYIEASPTKSRSHTIAVASEFLKAYGSSHPQDEIEHMDLWSTALPPFDDFTIDAKFAVLRKQQFSAEQLARWHAVQAVSRRFNAADKYVFSVPMWNFGVPYVLKHYVDVVTLPGENWTWSRERGYGTILTGKKALLIYASANVHAQTGDNATDYQKPYMRQWLRFIGITDVKEICVAPTLADPDEVSQTRAAAIEAALSMARQF